MIPSLGFVQVVFRGLTIPEYFVNQMGDIWSERHIVFLNPSRLGYLGVALRYKGQTLKPLVQWLVAEAFIGPRPIGYDVCHFNGINSDNHLSNLRYDTRSGNLGDRSRHGTTQFGERNPAAVLTNQEATELKSRRLAGESLKSLSKAFSVRESTVSRIANGKRRNHQ